MYYSLYLFHSLGQLEYTGCFTSPSAHGPSRNNITYVSQGSADVKCLLSFLPNHSSYPSYSSGDAVLLLRHNYSTAIADLAKRTNWDMASKSYGNWQWQKTSVPAISFDRRAGKCRLAMNHTQSNRKLTKQVTSYYFATDEEAEASKLR